MNCPKCNEATAHRSHRAGMADWLMGLLNRTPYRCRSCKARFYVFRHGENSPKLRTREEVKIMQLRRSYKWKRSKRVMIAYGMGGMMLLILLYFLMQQRMGSDG